VRHGRTYHVYEDVPYFYPNDEQEQNRLDLQHHLYGLCLDGKHFLAPIATPHGVLDIGTGTGIWAIEVADMYPSARVIGTDLSPIQPTWGPPNLQFQVDDSRKTWSYSWIFDLISLSATAGVVERGGLVLAIASRTKTGWLA
jgi:trans-aconitate methyltransferase